MGGRAQRRREERRPSRGVTVALSAGTMFAGVAANFSDVPTISQVAFGLLAVTGAAVLAAAGPSKKAVCSSFSATRPAHGF